MKTQKEYMESIKNEFIVSFKLHKDILDAHCYSDDRARDLVNEFKEKVKMYGLQFSNCYHANGIGNNNEYTIYLETKDADGFIIQKNIATFYYCYGIYGGCHVSLTDLSTGEIIKIGRAR